MPMAASDFPEAGGDKAEHVKHVKADDSPKGQPKTEGKGKRERSPEGGGVAGERSGKKHKNAYEISECCPGQVRVRKGVLMGRGQSRYGCRG